MRKKTTANDTKQITIRLNIAAIEQAEQVLEKRGLSLQDGIRIFVFAVIDANGIPFTLSSKDDSAITK